MSRSKKKNPVLKDKGLRRKEYSKIIRRVQKQYVSEIAKGNEDIAIPHQYSIINGYDICDYVFAYFNKNSYYTDEEWKSSIERIKRK